MHRESVFGAHPGAVDIVLGAHSGAVKLPETPVVIYQTEVPGTSWFTANYKARLARALCVWDAAPEFKTGQAVMEPGLFPNSAAASRSSSTRCRIEPFGRPPALPVVAVPG